MGRGRDAGWWWEQMGSPYLPHPAQPRHARSGRPGADTTQPVSHTPLPCHLLAGASGFPWSRFWT